MMEGELIYVAIIMQIGMLITLMVWSNLSLTKYFKKENFKLGVANTKALNRLDLRKIEKEMGLSKSKEIVPPVEAPNTLSTLANLAPLLKNLDGDQIMALADRFLGGGGEDVGAGGGGGLENILDNIPPELVEGFLKGLATKDDSTQTAGEIGQ